MRQPIGYLLIPVAYKCRDLKGWVEYDPRFFIYYYDGDKEAITILEEGKKRPVEVMSYPNMTIVDACKEMVMDVGNRMGLKVIDVATKRRWLPLMGAEVGEYLFMMLLWLTMGSLLGLALSFFLPLTVKVAAMYAFLIAFVPSTILTLGIFPILPRGNTACIPEEPDWFCCGVAGKPLDKYRVRERKKGLIQWSL
jgi:hypothetical protein